MALLAEHGDRIVRDEDFVAGYSDRVGRPSDPAVAVANVLLLQFRTGASEPDGQHAARNCSAGGARCAIGQAADRVE